MVSEVLDALIFIFTSPFLMGWLAIFPILWLAQYWLVKDMSREEFDELIRDIEENRKETIGVM
jgi:hypothetical protein